MAKVDNLELQFLRSAVAWTHHTVIDVHELEIDIHTVIDIHELEIDIHAYRGATRRNSARPLRVAVLHQWKHCMERHGVHRSVLHFMSPMASFPAERRNEMPSPLSPGKTIDCNLCSKEPRLGA
jgi:hypothetical protein